MLTQQGKLEEQKDGMDLSMAILHKEKKELFFAGANNPLILIRRKKQAGTRDGLGEPALSSDHADLFEIKGDRQPIGFHWEERKFTTHRIPLMENDIVYVFTDGFIDQFGGEQRKKFKAHRFRSLLLSLQEESLDRQKVLLEEAFNTWRNGIEQIDDVCVIGLRV